MSDIIITINNIIIIIIIIAIIITIIPPYSRVHQMFWTGVFLGPCSSSPLRGPRNLRGIFAGYELFPVVLLFGDSEILSSSKVFGCFTRSLGIALRAPITTGTTVAFFSYSLSTSTFRYWYLVIFSTSF